MADYLDYASADAAATEEEKRRRLQNPTVPEAIGQAWDKFTDRFTDSQGEFSPGKAIVSGLVNGANQQTQMEKQLMQGIGAPVQPGFITGSRPGEAPAIPVQPQPQIPTAYAAGAQPPAAPIQPPITGASNTYADRIGQNEGGAAGYDAIFGHGGVGGDPSIPATTGGRNLSQMTIGDALKIADSRMDRNAGAIGKYGFMPSTVRGLMNTAGLTENDMFDPANQDKLFGALTAANGAQLQRQGIEPTEANLALAHQVGAGGAARLLDPANANLNAADVLGLTGAGRTTNPHLDRPVSEYVASINSKFTGGVPRVAAVGREMGMEEPGYGGTETTPEDTVKRQNASILTNAHATVEELASIVGNPNTDKLTRQVALDRMSVLMEAPKKMAQANATITASANGDPTATRELTNSLKPPKDGKNEGSWLKALLLAKLGLSEAATREFALLGVGGTEHEINIDGQRGMVTLDPKGVVVKGYLQGKDGESRDMSAAEISQANEIANKQKYKPEIGSTTYMNKDLGIGGRVVTKIGSSGKTETFIESGGKLYPFSDKWKPTNEFTQLNVAGAKKVLDLQFAGPMAYTEAGAKVAGDFNARHNTNIGYRTMAPGQSPILVDFNNDGQPVIKDSNGTIKAVPNTTGGEASGVSTVSGGAPTSQTGATSNQTVIQQGIRNPYASQVNTTEPPIVSAATPNAVAATNIPGLPDIKEPKFQEPGFENEGPDDFKGRKKIYDDALSERTRGLVANVNAAEKPIVARNMMAVQNAKEVYDVTKQISDALEKATGSYFGAKIDNLAGAFGKSTEGARAIAKLQVLGTTILMNVPRFEGPQSDKDTQTYKEAAGQLANPEIPVATRIAAFKTIQEINKKYAPNLDWDFGKKAKDGDVDQDLLKRFGG